MKKEEAVIEFEKEMREKSTTYRKEIIKYFLVNRENCEIELKQFVNEFCVELRNKKKYTVYIIMWPLRTSLLEQNLIYELNAYSESLYFEEPVYKKEYHCKWLYKFIAEYEEKAVLSGKKYINLIGRGEIERVIQKNFGVFNDMFKEIYMSVFNGFNSWEIYKEINKSEEIRVFISEYMDIPQEIEI